jgi:hypothetical protein
MITVVNKAPNAAFPKAKQEGIETALDPRQQPIGSLLPGVPGSEKGRLS